MNAADDSVSVPLVRKPLLHVVAGCASIGAGLLHVSAVGLHAEKPDLARVFVVLALLQLAVGAAQMIRPRSIVLAASLAVNAVAVGGWLITRLSGISWIDGLQNRESPQLADTICAGLGLVAVGSTLGLLVLGSMMMPEFDRRRALAPLGVIGVAVVVGMWSGTTHVHDHGDELASGVDHHSAADTGVDDDGHPHTSDSSGHSAADVEHGHSTDWPRPYDPALDIDISGVPGVTPEQESRARELIVATQSELPRWADYDSAVAQGWISIGDERTGHEHLVNRRLIVDGKFLDPSAPESLVYAVENGTKTLVSAMFMAEPGVAIDDPKLTDYAGPLMQWHVHDNLCFRNDGSGRSVVAGVLDAQGECPTGSTLAGLGIAMVHVWIAPHPCGPFAALEGEGAGRAAVSEVERVDMCAHDHGSTSSDLGAAAASMDDGSARIDLSLMPGVSAEQRARAEELVYRTRTTLPQFAEVAVAEAMGFSSIGDAATGYEHYINWDYINDAHELDPSYPESLVFEVDRTTGKKKLVSAMFMMGDQYSLENVPDIGGPLTQWHIHDNLCFNRDPMIHGSTRVVGVTSPNGSCAFGIKLKPNPMIHVWLVPHECGPFAALEGVGAGQIRSGEERLCDHAHAGH